MTWARVARWRVPLGFAAFAAAFWFAAPSPTTIVVGGLVAAIGQMLRIWAAGHIEKGREVTRSGPYRYIRHPLYAGSLLMGLGFVVAAATWTAGLLAVAYFSITYLAAVRSEEATLDARFDGEYAAYRDGRAPVMDRRFSLHRAFVTNRELRSVAGLLGAFGLLIAWTLGR